MTPASLVLFHPSLNIFKHKFYMETPYDREMKVCLNGVGHMTKMATTPIIYAGGGGGGGPFNIFSITRRHMTLGLGMLQQGCETY